MSIATFLHDPDDELDYTTTVEGLAESEVVSAATVAAPEGLTLNPSPHSTAFTDSTVTFWITGGTLGEVYDVVVHITTDQGRQADQTLRFRCVQR